METKKEIGTFKGITFHEEVIDFIVKSDGIYCDVLSKRLRKEDQKRPIRMLQLKPNFQYWYFDNFSRCIPRYFKESGMHNSLIKRFEIDKNLLITMSQLQLIRYSKEMAIFYDFDTEFAFDKEQQTRSFKHVGPDKFLEKAKKGIFN